MKKTEMDGLTKFFQNLKGFVFGTKLQTILTPFIILNNYFSEHALKRKNKGGGETQQNVLIISQKISDTRHRNKLSTLLLFLHQFRHFPPKKYLWKCLNFLKNSQNINN